MVNIEKLNPFPEEGNVYGVVSHIENLENEEYSVTLDLINKEMIQYDNEYIYDDNLNRSQNPKENLYIYFATIIIKKNEYSNFFPEPKTDQFYEYTIYRKDSNDTSNHILNDKVMECNLYFSASPISEESYYIKCIREKIKIPMTIPAFKKNALDNIKDIKKEFDAIFDRKLEAKYFNVHNIGQGSCNTVEFYTGMKGKDNFKLFYDIGISKYTNKDPNYGRYLTTYSKFIFNKYDAVIISHWDQDHYAGVCQDENGVILKKVWIVPDFGLSPNLLRITYIIDNYGMLVRIANSLKGFLYRKDDLFLFKGDGSVKNDNGIILAINNGEKNLVAMGDASYDCCSAFISGFSLNASRKAFEKIDFLIVPHHGADVSGNINFIPKVSVKTSGAIRPSDAIISVGYNQKNYGHPRNSTVVKLADKGFRIMRTDTDGRIRVKF